MTEAARIIGMPRSTLDGWVRKHQMGTLIKGTWRVSFNELIDLYSRRHASGKGCRCLIPTGKPIDELHHAVDELHQAVDRHWTGIVISPYVRSGMPQVRGVPVSVIADRARVETIEAVVADYPGLLPQHVKAAVAWSCTSYPVGCPIPECCHERCPYWPVPDSLRQEG
jgi:uncharacterized protein (DUF433 family)